MEERIKRINELAKRAKDGSITPEEAEERAVLRAAYLADFRKSFKSTLDNTVVEYEGGVRIPLKDAPKGNLKVAIERAPKDK
ncbi:MAG: DUF896 domain-containing protein [Clostridia bacterium]